MAFLTMWWWKLAAQLVKGARQTVKNLRRARSVVSDAIFEVTRKYAFEIFDRSQALVPEATGELKRSGSVSKDEGVHRVSFWIKYTASHALVQHEGISPRTGKQMYPGPKTRSKPGTKDGMPGAKYLTRPLKNVRKAYIKELGVATGRSIRKISVR